MICGIRMARSTSWRVLGQRTGRGLDRRHAVVAGRSEAPATSHGAIIALGRRPDRRQRAGEDITHRRISLCRDKGAGLRLRVLRHRERVNGLLSQAVQARLGVADLTLQRVGGITRARPAALKFF
jgi:hypothetical protein